MLKTLNISYDNKTLFSIFTTSVLTKSLFKDKRTLSYNAEFCHHIDFIQKVICIIFTICSNL